MTYPRFLLLIISTFVINSIACANAQFKIFILHSYSQEYPWTKSQHEAFVETYNASSTKPAVFVTEHMDTKRKDYDSQYAHEFTSYLKDKYSGYTPDIIYVTDDNAAQFSIHHLIDVFPSVPVIFSGVNDFSILEKTDTDKMTGVFEKKEISPNLQLLKFIDSNLHVVTVLGDDSSTDRSIKLELSEQLKLHPEIKANYIQSNQIEKIAEELESRHIKYLILTTIGGISDSAGQNQTLAQVVSTIKKPESIIISMEDSYLLKGVLGGYVTSGRRQGRAAAELVLMYQQGTPINSIPSIKNSPNEYIFDYNELNKNNITLPDSIVATAEILNKPPSLYQRYRNIVIGSIVVLTLLVILLMAAFILFISRKNKKIEITSRKLENQALKLKQIKDKLTTAQEIAHLGNWEFNYDSNLVTWSDEVYRILGESPDSIAPDFETMISYIPDNEQDKVRSAIMQSIRTSNSFEIEHRIARKDGSLRYIRQVGDIHKLPDDQKSLLVGTILDITQIKQNEITELERLAKIERYQEALFEWSRVDYENIEQAFKRATEISANTLDISRVSIWLYNDDYTEIHCQNMYIKNSGHEKGSRLFKTDFPNYFKALRSGKMIVVNNAREDVRTSEFTTSYLIPNNIYSMLDAPIYYAGEVVGVVCHESTHSIHTWTSQEQEFASAIANTVSLSLEIQKRKQIEKELEYQAYHDALTTLPNRSLFIDRLDQAIKLAKRNQTMLAVLFLDLDNFKQINDSLGHDTGDQVLMNIAERLIAGIRETDSIARLGGDEFTLIVSGFNDSHSINQTIQKLFSILQQPMHINGDLLYATCSVGISIYPDDGETSETLIKNADAAMYKAKDAGRNSFEFYTHDMTERAFEHVMMDANLRRAFAQHQFIIYYQPQYDSSQHKITGMEALLRWNHPEMGMISPSKFIPVAENTGLIVELDRWVMQNAIQQVSQWRRSGIETGRLSLNMATKQLEKKDLLEFVKNCLHQSQCRPEWITFEITESQIMKNPEKSISLLKELSMLGIEIAVDDFGTGYSSLTYLKRLPVDKLKIDSAFINELPHDDEDVAIVRAIIALAKSMKLDVIAEGVENQQQIDFLLEAGCPEIQGFFFAKPMPADQIESFLSRHSS